MSAPVFSFPVSYASKMTMKPRILAAAFGDGYEQRVLDGINNELESWQITAHSTGEIAGASAVETFLRTQAGVTVFQWTTKFGRTALFICKTWDRTPVAPGVTTITAMFEERPA